MSMASPTDKIKVFKVMDLQVIRHQFYDIG